MAALIEFLSENDTKVVAWAADLMLAGTNMHNHPQFVVMNKHNALTYTVNVETWERIRDEMREAAIRALAKEDGDG